MDLHIWVGWLAAAWFVLSGLVLAGLGWARLPNHQQQLNRLNKTGRAEPQALLPLLTHYAEGSGVPD